MILKHIMADFRWGIFTQLRGVLLPAEGIDNKEKDQDFRMTISLLDAVYFYDNYILL
jgi:hypothetical protein